MEKERKRKLMWRWSLITAGLIALFWTMWYLITGQVPVMTSIKMTPELTWQLPFGISRWWDILIGPIWSFILISFFTNERITKNEGLVFGLVFGLVAGLGFGLVFGLGFGLVFGLVFGLGAGLSFGLVAFIEWVLSKRFWKSVGYWLIAKNTNKTKEA